MARNMRSLLDSNKRDLALVVGNGINRYNAPPGANSWETLLTTLTRLHLDPTHTSIPKGVSLTEFYDVLDLAVRRSRNPVRLQSEFCSAMASWTRLPQHVRVSEWAQRWSVPILTTNFEQTLSEPAATNLEHCRKEKFTAFYPWSSCYSPTPVSEPLSTFAIWHINGMQKYRQSIRLGLSHYMGSVERTRMWLHKSGTRLFGSADIHSWPGSNTWLQVFFHKPLLFFGIGLDENEVFLRWLLIERARYFNKFPSRAQKGWYAYVNGSSNLGAGKELFLKGVGIEPYPVPNYQSLYEATTWQ
jgi:hypothetical protein